MKKSIDKFPIKPGELWQAGRHIFYCGDIEENAIEKFVKKFSIVSYMIYSDPPWNAGSARYWRTQTHVRLSRKVDINNLWNCFCNGVMQTKPEIIFIEQSIPKWKDFMKIARENNFPKFIGKWECYYGAPVTKGDYFVTVKSPDYLLRFENNKDIKSFDPSGLKGLDLVDYIFKNTYIENRIVFDPCIGKGAIARMAHKYNMVCYGIEINPERLAVTLDYLSKFYKIEKIGKLN